MKDWEAPNNVVVALAFFEDFNDFAEELSVFEFPVNQIEVEDVAVKDVFGLNETEDVLVASRAQYIVQGFEFADFFLGRNTQESDFSWLRDNRSAFACVCGVERILPFLGEVEFALEGFGVVSRKRNVDDLSLFVAKQWDGALRNVHQELDFKVRARNIGD